MGKDDNKPFTTVGKTLLLLAMLVFIFSLLVFFDVVDLPFLHAGQDEIIQKYVNEFLSIDGLVPWCIEEMNTREIQKPTLAIFFTDPCSPCGTEDFITNLKGRDELLSRSVIFFYPRFTESDVNNFSVLYGFDRDSCVICDGKFTIGWDDLLDHTERSEFRYDSTFILIGRGGEILSKGVLIRPDQVLDISMNQVEEVVSSHSGR